MTACLPGICSWLRTAKLPTAGDAARHRRARAAAAKCGQGAQVTADGVFRKGQSRAQVGGDDAAVTAQGVQDQLFTLLGQHGWSICTKLLVLHDFARIARLWGKSTSGARMQALPNLRVIKEEVLSNDWYVLKKTSFELRLAGDGSWQRQSRETCTGATAPPSCCTTRRRARWC